MSRDVIGLHLTGGSESTVNARIVVSRRGSQVICMTSVAEVVNRVKVEAREKLLLASGKDVQICRSVFDGHRGQSIYRDLLY